ncbi:DNA fragmentation factor subunit beta [Coccinella septempunctata]|uniref:DNA fragmentation factor subunit beta n=1 Tax=Coccinella septempunctata TaxID=41139 RepID=UPI001D06631B|nr:DNA fragmentation factor subunit beta [Coccinella septempunctata]
MMTTSSSKGFKVTDAERKTRVGIAAKDLEELKIKTIQKFKLKLTPSEINFQLPDGTFVETNDYFETLKSHTLLIWVKHGEIAHTDAEILYKTIRDVNQEYLTAGEKIQEFFSENMKSKVYKLAELLRGIDDDKSKISLKSEHPEWFDGLDTSAKTKEDYMFRKAQDRIRTFFYRTKEELRKHTELPQDELQFLLLELNNRLKNSKYNGHYFDRRKWHEDDILKCICNESGNFSCQGRWDKERCLYETSHQINPYRSREERIVFQCWNLDHVKERSRSIIPAIREALKHKLTLENAKNFASLKKEIYIDTKSIYNDLFTTKNLKLVHIVCHDKGAHNEKAGPYLLI